MDTLLMLLGFAVFAVPVCIVVLFVGQSRLRKRMAKAERELVDLRSRLLAQPVANTSERMLSAQAAVESAVSPPERQETRLPEAAQSEDAVSETPPVGEIVPSVPDAGSSPWDRAQRREQEKLKGTKAADQNRPIVMRPDRIAALGHWLKINWVYAISALSLALAGVFFVQYGIENGLLPPAARVLAGIIFGMTLVAVGEWMRRRHGDEGEHASALLPSVFSGAGLVSIFAAILAARQMYGLIGPQMAFAGHLVTAALAVALGWFYGPLLVAVGLLGAALSPFIVAGGADAGPWLYGYFALVATVGLAVDAVRRWGWVSVLALILGGGGGWLVMQAGAGVPGWIAALLALAVLATILPELSVLPRHAGPCVLLSMTGRGKSGWPPFPVRLAAGASLASTIGLTLLAANVEGEALLALVALTGLALTCLIWADKAEGLADLALLPTVGLMLSLMLQGAEGMPLQRAYLAAATYLRAPEAAPPMTISLLLGMAVLVGLGFAWRSFRAGSLQLVCSLAAVLVAPLTAVLLEFLWHPAQVIGAYPWAVHVIALAALMVFLALRYAKADGDSHRRFAYSTLSALSLIALAVFLVVTNVALTLAVAVLVVVAAGLDRRFKLPEMRFFIQIGSAVLWYRLFGNPGIDWAMIAPLGQVILAFGGTIAAFALALRLLDPLDRPTATGVLESAAAGLIAVLINVLLTRKLIPEISVDGLETYWGATVNAMPWSILMLVQLYRIRLGGPMKRVRQGIALVAAFVAGGGLLAAAAPFNPLFVGNPDDPKGFVEGPLLFDSLALAYLLPGLMLLLAGWKMPGLARRWRLVFFAVGGPLVMMFLGLEIRRFWEGDWLGRPGVVQGELYNYTVALMLIGAGLLFLAIRRRSGLLRRIAMAVIGLTILKVFLLDASGLTGLTRVVSFLGLGLSLAGLAWLNRWAGTATEAKSG